MPNQINEYDSVCLKDWKIEFQKAFKNGLGEINYDAYDNEDNAVDQFEDKTVEIMLFISQTIDQTVEEVIRNNYKRKECVKCGESHFENEFCKYDFVYQSWLLKELEKVNTAINSRLSLIKNK